MIVNVAEDVVFEDILGVTLGPNEETRVPVPRMMHRWTVTIDTAPSFLLTVEECPCALKCCIGIVYLPVPTDAPDWNTRRRVVDYGRWTDKVNCTCPYTSNRCARGFTGKRDQDACHGWHRPKVDALAARIRKPITPRAALTAALRTVGNPRDLDARARPSYEQLAELKAFETLVT